MEVSVITAHRVGQLVGSVILALSVVVSAPQAAAAPDTKVPIGGGAGIV